MWHAGVAQRLGICGMNADVGSSLWVVARALSI